MRARRCGVHEMLIQLTSLEITHFFYIKNRCPPTKICILTFTPPRLKELIFRLNNYTSKLAYVLLIDPIK